MEEPPALAGQAFLRLFRMLLLGARSTESTRDFCNHDGDTTAVPLAACAAAGRATTMSKSRTEKWSFC